MFCAGNENRLIKHILILPLCILHIPVTPWEGELLQCPGNNGKLLQDGAAGAWWWSRLAISGIAAQSPLQLTHSLNLGICVLQQSSSYTGAVYNELLQNGVYFSDSFMWIMACEDRRSATGVFCKSLSAPEVWHNFLLQKPGDATRAAQWWQTLPVVCSHHSQGTITHFAPTFTLFW